MIRFAIEIDGKRHQIALPPGMLAASPGTGSAAAPVPEEAAPGTVTAPVAGTLSLWQIGDGETVEAGQVIAVIEAMKMETQIEAPHAGRLTHLASAGDMLAQGAPIGRIDAG
ncbi:acetyl-CoA carboxylase biotin carboxyl carrier protein subunit [Paracoccus nototheniae]